jgi:hypothetical protein
MTDAEPYWSGDSFPDAYAPAERLALVDLLDRVLAGGVVITGEITLSVADVDLVVISLRALISSVGALAGQAMPGDTVPGDTVPGDNVPGHVVEAELDGEHEG